MSEKKFSQQHEWISIEGEVATVGITKHASEMLGDVVFVELPDQGKSIEKDGQAGVVESTKAASDIYSPIAGEVVDTNKSIVDDPAAVNKDPEGKIIAREKTKIFSLDNQEIGSVTSGTFGPSVNRSIAMGYVKYNFSKVGTKILLEVRGKKHEAKVSELPFYKKSYARWTVNEKKFSKQHEWISTDGEVATVGITEHAVEMLGDIVFVELPKKGKNVEKEGQAGVVESTKAASDIYSPIAGEVTEVNQSIVDDPAAVNKDPEGNAWFFKIKVKNKSDIDILMSKADYEKFAKENPN